MPNTTNNKQYQSTYIGTIEPGAPSQAARLQQRLIRTAVPTSTDPEVFMNSLSVGTTNIGDRGDILATGNITAYYSDERLKTKVGDIEDALGKVRRLSGFLYHANETAVQMGYDPAKIEVGLSAQSVQLVQPEVVRQAPVDNNYLTVDYARLVPLLIEAIKELDLQVQAIKNGTP